MYLFIYIYIYIVDQLIRCQNNLLCNILYLAVCLFFGFSVCYCTVSSVQSCFFCVLLGFLLSCSLPFQLDFFYPCWPHHPVSFVTE